jgi:RimJ/RimL family protein N-acetyltransferase
MFEGKLTRLRVYKREDLKKVWNFINQENTMKFLRPGIPFPYRFEEEEKWYDSISAMSEKNYTFAIERIEDDEYIGGCGINEIDWKNSYCEIGIFLSEDYCGKGYGTDALRTLVDFIFNEMNLNKVMLNVYSFNDRAISSYKNVGFVEEGRLREHIFRNGKYSDELIMSILRSDWREMKEKGV